MAGGMKLREASRQAHTHQAECVARSTWFFRDSVKETVFRLSGNKEDLVWIYTQVKNHSHRSRGDLQARELSCMRNVFCACKFKNKVKHRDIRQAFSEMSLLHLTINSWKLHKIILMSYV